jgi:hypothetical protein
MSHDIDLIVTRPQLAVITGLAEDVSEVKPTRSTNSCCVPADVSQNARNERDESSAPWVAPVADSHHM